MKAIEIPHKQREHFKKSFLHNVSLMLYLDKDLNIEASMEFMKDRKWELLPLKEQRINILHKENRSISIMFMGNIVVIAISAPSYTSFDDINNIATDITTILKSDNIKVVNNIHILKENRYKLKHEQNKGKEWLIETLFSKEFAQSYPANDESLSFNTHEYMNTILLKQDQENDGIDSLTFRIMTSNYEDVNTEHWHEKIKMMNENLYDVWRWAISDNVIKMMTK